MLSTIVMAIFGFGFWTIGSRLYSPRAIGIATSTVSAVSLLSALSTLGYNNSIIRFLSHSSRKNEILSTGFTVTSCAAIVVSLIFVVLESALGKTVVIESSSAIVIVTIVLYTIILTMNSIIDSAFIALRSTKYILQKNAVMSVLKLILAVLAVAFGFLGIVGSVAAATGVAVVIGLLRLSKELNYRPAAQVDRCVVRDVWRFAAGNYVGSVFGLASATVLPLIVVYQLGATAAAYFYMPLMIVTLLNVIPGASAQSAFAEMSHDESQNREHLKKALVHIYSLLTPAVLLVIVLGGPVLSLFGAAYAEAGAAPLRILAFASLIGAANYLGSVLLTVKKRIGLYMFMNAFNAIVILVPASAVVHRGLEAISWSVLAGQLLTAILYLIIHGPVLVERVGSPSRA
jgi:O-antigen/teichoic acid export membrane protein